MKMKFLNIILIISFHQINGISYSIPTHLVPCYRKSYQDQLNKPPLNIQLLIELIRKFEFKKRNAINMRMFTTSILHSTRYDGVMYTPGLPETEFTIPYRANGKQFYKFKLLVDYMISGKPELILDELDSVKDLCLLHEIISSTTQIYPSRDNFCPKLEDVTYKGVDYLSQDCCCFVEGGVVNTKWGVISPGHIIAGVAAALQEMSMEMQNLVPIIQKESNQTKNNFEYTGSINNVRIATIAGDLGELTLQQAFNKPQFGNYGLWNDTSLPRIYYLPDIRYEMTSAELLGGIDGAIFAENIKIWRSTIRRTRLSQLIDMYYSKRGIVFDNAYRACDRRSNLRRILEKYNLTEDTYKAANLLNEVSDLTWNPDPTSLLKYAEVVTAGFLKEAESQTTKYSDCDIQTYQVQPLEVLTIFDESWTRYEIEAFLGPLTEAIDLSFYGSSLGIINSESTTWFTNVTDSLVQLYDDIYQSRHMLQKQLILSKALDAAATYLQKKTRKKCTKISRVPRATVILIFTQTATLAEDDKNSAKEVLNTIKITYPETAVVYITSRNNADSYLELAQDHVNDAVIKASEPIQNVMPEIMKILIKIPNRIMDFYCNNTEIYVEDYLTPGESKIYELHSEYIRRVDFVVKFKGYDYGDASVCVYDSKTPMNKICKGVGGNDEVSFLPNNYCVENYPCNVQFSVEVAKSNFKCSEFDCRYPDQMRIEITSTWTKRSGSTTIRYNIYGVVVVLLGICLTFYEH